MERGDELDYKGRKRSKYWSINDEPSVTVQSDAHLADIENILAQWNITGQDSLDEAELQFRDISEFTDYHDLMLNVRDAEVAFMKLPSKVREIFDHSVEKWLDTAHDEEKRDALVSAGFLEAPKVVPKEPELKAPERPKEEPASESTEGSKEGGSPATGAE